MSVSEGTAPHISVLKGEEGEGGQVEKFSVSRPEIRELVEGGPRESLRDPEQLAEELGIKAGIVLWLPLLSHTLTYLASLSVEEAGWHPSPGQVRPHTLPSLRVPTDLFQQGVEGTGKASASWERSGHSLTRGTSLLGIPAGLTITCRHDAGACRPGRGNVR